MKPLLHGNLLHAAEGSSVFVISAAMIQGGVERTFRHSPHQPETRTQLLRLTQYLRTDLTLERGELLTPVHIPVLSK